MLRNLVPPRSALLALIAALVLAAPAQSSAKNAASAPKEPKTVHVTMLSPTIVPGNMTKSLAKLLPRLTPYKFTLLESEKDPKVFLIRLPIDFAKQKLPRLTIVVDNALRTYDKKKNIALVNLVRVRAVPDIPPLTTAGQKQTFTAFVTAWEADHLIPQGLYLDPQGRPIMAWDIPVTINAPVFPAQVAYVIDAMAETWAELGPALRKAGLMH